MADLQSLEMPVTYTKLLVRDHPAGAAVLRGTGIENLSAIDDIDSVAVVDFLQVVRNCATLTRRLDWHLEWARRMADHFHGPLSFALMSAPTLGAGIDTWVKYVGGRIPYFKVAARHGPGRYRFEMRETVELGNLRSLLVEIPMLIVHNYMQTHGAVALHEARMEFAYPQAPAASYYQRWFTCPLYFEAPCNAFEFPRTWFEVPNPAHDAGTWRSSIAKCELAAGLSGSRDLLTNTRALIAEAAEEKPGELTQEAVARRLHVSVRTLIRHLKHADTSFQTLRDDALKNVAVQLLRRPGLGIGEVAIALGYSDTANFARAFKRWFGKSPGAFRKTID